MFILTESQIEYVLNSLNGKFDAWCDALPVVNTIYVNGQIGSKICAGQAYAMYTSPVLANLAVNVLNGTCLRGCEQSAKFCVLNH